MKPPLSVPIPLHKRLDSAVAKLRAGAAFDSVCLEYSDDGNKDKGGIYDACIYRTDGC